MDTIQASATKKEAFHARFQDAIWYDPSFPGMITLGGAGGIGSWLALLLARAGYDLVVYDPDVIDETNMAGQLYPSSSIGRTKSGTVAENVIAFGGKGVYMQMGLLEESSPITNVVFSAFDNMKARKILFEKWATLALANPSTFSCFIDGRMLAEAGHVYFVLPENIEAYRTQIFDDKLVGDQPCSMKATSHCGAHISSIMMTGFTNIIANVKLKADIREVPFKIEFELPLLAWTHKTPEQCKESSKTDSVDIMPASQKSPEGQELLDIVS